MSWLYGNVMEAGDRQLRVAGTLQQVDPHIVMGAHTIKVAPRTYTYMYTHIHTQTQPDFFF